MHYLNYLNLHSLNFLNLHSNPQTNKYYQKLLQIKIRSNFLESFLLFPFQLLGSVIYSDSISCASSPRYFYKCLLDFCVFSEEINCLYYLYFEGESDNYHSYYLEVLSIVQYEVDLRILTWFGSLSSFSWSYLVFFRSI